MQRRQGAGSRADRLLVRLAAWPVWSRGTARSPGRRLATQSVSAALQRWQAVAEVDAVSLTVLEKGEEEEPEHAHRVPVPDGGVYSDLAGGELAGASEKSECRDERGDAEEKVSGVCNCDEVEKVAACAGVEQHVLCAKLGPGNPLAGEKECAERQSAGEPDRRAAGGGSAEAEPLVHQGCLAKNGAP